MRSVETIPEVGGEAGTSGRGQRSEDPSAAAAGVDDLRPLRAVEVLLVAILLCIGLARGEDAAWPFIAWPMYARTFRPPPKQVSEIQLRLVGHDGRVTTVMPYDIFGHVEIDLGREIALRAFQDRPDRAAYRDVLKRRMQPVLSAVGAVQIQGWRLTWETHPRALPPFDLEHPVAESMQGRTVLTALAPDPQTQDGR